jgi:formamidopyrimidine-DNA glycosylase
MPELPEVEHFKKYLESTSLHKTITEAAVKNSQILEDVAEDELENMLASKEFVSSQRYGKYLFTNVSEEFWLVMHFGMTGKLKYFKALKYDPEHDRLLIGFENGYHLAFDCQRKFGKITTTSKIEDFIKKKQLGEDALQIDFQGFEELMQKRRGAVKYTLMNQHILAGIGNIYSDEIAFQTGVHPKTKINELDEKRLRDMFNNMKRVLKTAIKNHADPRRLPKSYLLTNRRVGTNCPRCGGEIQTLKFSGRTTYFCSNHQKPT